MKNVNPIFIPDELKNLPLWVCWRADRKDNGRTDKLPLDRYDPRKKVNSLSNCEGWFSAFQKVSNNRSLGLGFYPNSEKTGLVGIDLDHVFDGHSMRPEALEIVRILDSYTEFSPSNTGLHIWIRSEFSPENHNGKILEVKSRGNSYLTVTGRCWGSPKPIEERTAQLREILAKYFPKEKPQKKAARFLPVCDDADTLRKLCSKPERLKLWKGDLSDYISQDGDASHSSADLTLCNYIYLCSNRDVSAIDRLFRQSGLMREKWDEIHSRDGLTYGQMTIRKVLTGKGI